MSGFINFLRTSVALRMFTTIAMLCGGIYFLTIDQDWLNIVLDFLIIIIGVSGLYIDTDQSIKYESLMEKTEEQNK